MASKTAVQKFEYREIPRAQIRTAEYNPREINQYQRGNLAKSLKKFGCVEPLIWNEKTGTLVSGHQRLSLIDETEGGDGYTIGVTVVSLTPKQERELNVLLNNKQAQGDFTTDGMLALMQGGLKLEDVCLTRLDLNDMIGDAAALDEVLAGLNAAAPPKKDKPAVEKLNKNKLRKDAADNPENDSGYYLVVHFEDSAAKDTWMQKRRLPVDTEHLSIGELEALCR